MKITTSSKKLQKVITDYVVITVLSAGLDDVVFGKFQVFFGG